jgi:hypothetical protein
MIDLIQTTSLVCTQVPTHVCRWSNIFFHNFYTILLPHFTQIKQNILNFTTLWPVNFTTVWPVNFATFLRVVYFPKRTKAFVSIGLLPSTSWAQALSKMLSPSTTAKPSKASEPGVLDGFLQDLESISRVTISAGKFTDQSRLS